MIIMTQLYTTNVGDGNKMRERDDSLRHCAGFCYRYMCIVPNFGEWALKSKLLYGQ